MTSDLIHKVMGTPRGMYFESEGGGAGGGTEMTGGEGASTVTADPTPEGNTEGSGGDGSPAWMAQLSDDLKTNEGLTGFKTISDLGKAFVDLQGSTDGAVKIPGENATADEMSAFGKARGVPENVDGYADVKPFDNLPEDFGYDEKLTEEFKQAALEAGMTAKEAKQIHDWHLKRSVAQHESYKKQIQDADKKLLNELKTEWGKDYKGNLEVAKRAAEAIGGNDLMTFFDETGLGNHPMLINIFHRIGSEISEDSALFRPSSGTGGDGVKRDSAGRRMLSFKMGNKP